MNHQHRSKCYTVIHYSPAHRWTNNNISAVCQKQTLIQIYKCKCTVSQRPMSDHIPVKTNKNLFWESKFFWSVDITKISLLLGFFLMFLHCKLKKKLKKKNPEVCFHYRVQVSIKLQNPPLRSILVTDKTYLSLRKPQKNVSTVTFPVVSGVGGSYTNQLWLTLQQERNENSVMLI